MLADALAYAKNSSKFFKDALKLKTQEEQDTAAMLIRLIQVRMQLTEDWLINIHKLKINESMNQSINQSLNINQTEYIKNQSLESRIIVL